MLGPKDRSPYDINANPGPGNYDLKGELPTPIKIGELTKGAKADDFPAPGQYDDPRTMKADSSKGQIHERPSPRRSAIQSPGPGQYNIPQSPIKDTQPIRIGNKHSTKIVNDVPPPGAYHKEKPFGSDARATTIPKPGRKVRSSYATPGPGTYSPRTSASKPSSPRYTISGARYTPRRDRTGEYRNLGSTLGGPKYSMGGTRAEITYW